jgi:hypothetical protein
MGNCNSMPILGKSRTYHYSFRGERTMMPADYMLKWIKKLFSVPKLSDAISVEETERGRCYIEMMKRCPACHHKPPEYMEGPSGGMCTNIFCNFCGQGYNITPIIGIAEKIHKDSRYVQKAKGTAR